MNKSQANLIIDSYLSALGKGDVDAIMALYAPKCSVEDPVGGEVQQDRDAVREFYNNIKDLKIQAQTLGEPRVTDHGNAIAFPFKITIDFGDNVLTQEIIDVFYCDQNNKIERMQAFWGAENAIMS